MGEPVRSAWDVGKYGVGPASEVQQAKVKAELAARGPLPPQPKKVEPAVEYVDEATAAVIAKSLTDLRDPNILKLEAYPDKIIRTFAEREGISISPFDRAKIITELAKRGFKP